MNDEGFQSILDEVSRVDPRAKKIKTQDLVDRRFLDKWKRAASSTSSGESINSAVASVS